MNKIIPPPLLNALLSLMVLNKISTMTLVIQLFKTSYTLVSQSDLLISFPLVSLFFNLWHHPNSPSPFTAKGRTNVELREQFTLASGVSQSMTPFKSKAPPAQASPTSSVSGETRNGGMQGPITKVCWVLLKWVRRKAEPLQIWLVSIGKTMYD